MERKALEYLNKNYLLYIDMIECINRGIAEIHYAADDGVLLTAKGSHAYMLAADDEKAAVRIMSGRDFFLVVVHDTSMLQALRDAFGMQGDNRCWQVAYTKKELLPEDDTDIRLLTPDYAETVAKIYHMGDTKYVEKLLRAEAIYGAFDGDKLMGFIGTHTEGAMGLLEVLPEYQRRGVGMALEINAINRALKKGQVPYAQLFITNPASEELQKKLGLSFADKNICWIWK